MPSELIANGITEGHTAEMLLTLRLSTGVFNLTGVTADKLAVILGPTYGQAAIERTGAADIRLADDPTSGQIYLKPQATDFKAALGPYTVRVRLTDDAGKVQFFPEGEPMLLRVYPAGAAG